MATTTRLGLTKLEVGQASKEATINGNYDILDIASSGGPTGAIWARVYHNANQSITTATLTALAFNSERWDTNVIHDTVTNNSRLTCKTAGIYQISATISFASNTTGYRGLYLRLNGATYICISQVPTLATAGEAGLTASTLYSLAVNDYVEAIAYQTSGAGLNVSAAANYSPEFMMLRVGS